MTALLPVLDNFERSIEANNYTDEDGTVLISGNNEYTLTGNGRESVEWQEDKDSFYHKAEIRKLHPVVQVLLFWKTHLHAVPRLFHQKINQAFDSPALCVTLLFFIVEGLFAYIRLARSRIGRVFGYLTGLGVVVAGFLFNPFVYVPYYIYFGFLVFFIRLCVRTEYNSLLPVPLKIIFLNFLAVTVLTFGHFRYVVVMEWIFILAAIMYSLSALALAIQVMNEQKRLALSRLTC